MFIKKEFDEAVSAAQFPEYLRRLRLARYADLLAEANWPSVEALSSKGALMMADAALLTPEVRALRAWARIHRLLNATLFLPSGLLSGCLGGVGAAISGIVAIVVAVLPGTSPTARLIAGYWAASVAAGLAMGARLSLLLNRAAESVGLTGEQVILRWRIQAGL